METTVYHYPNSLPIDRTPLKPPNNNLFDIYTMGSSQQSRQILEIGNIDDDYSDYDKEYNWKYHDGDLLGEEWLDEEYHGIDT
eukprot:scaffold64756_cov67-Cyclotella_meneghiniana.AAC.1